jgi:hypothetical protein
MEVMMYFLWAEIVTLGTSTMGFGSNTQHCSLAYVGLGSAPTIPAFILNLTKLLGLRPLAGMLHINRSTRGPLAGDGARQLPVTPWRWPSGQ